VFRTSGRGYSAVKKKEIRLFFEPLVRQAKASTALWAFTLSRDVHGS